MIKIASFLDVPIDAGFNPIEVCHCVGRILYDAYTDNNLATGWRGALFC